MDGINPGYAPNNEIESYTVKIFDNSYVYYVSNVAILT